MPIEDLPSRGDPSDGDHGAAASRTVAGLGKRLEACARLVVATAVGWLLILAVSFWWQWRQADSLEHLAVFLLVGLLGGAGLLLIGGRLARSEASLRAALEQQNRCTRRLESLGLLADVITHDLNNKLVSVLGDASLAALTLPAASPLHRPFREIETAARRTSDLCRRLLACFGKGAFVAETLDLNRIVEETAGLVQVSISKRAELRLQPASRRLAVRADAMQLRQLVVNLVISASEASGARPGTITLTTGSVALDPARDTVAAEQGLSSGQHAYLEVSDGGAQLDPATRARLFDPFIDAKAAGRGLGLPAALEIAQAHRGAITVESTRRGTTFRVLLPEVSSDGIAASGSAPAPWQDERCSREGTVLLVDDEAPVVDFGRRILERLGLTPLIARDGRSGVEVFAAHADEIRAVFLDLTLPQMGGREALAEIRRHRADVPVILMSGHGEPESDDPIARARTAGFLRKPFSVTTFTNALRLALGTPEPSVPASLILLVDDDAEVRRAARAILERLGHAVVEAANGREALTEFERHRDEIDLVILDQLMPGMDGADVFLALKERCPDVTVLFASADRGAAAAQTLLSHGVAGFVAKPYGVEDLRRALAAALGSTPSVEG